MALPYDARVRIDLAAAHHQWRQRNTEFAEYIGSDGKKSTGSKGLAMQISRRIKQAFGAAHDDLDMSGMIAVTAVFHQLDRIMAEGQERGRPRADIKQALYDAIRRGGDAYRASLEAFNDD